MKNRHLRARLPQDEYKALQEAADVAGLTVSEHVRNVLLRDRQAQSQEQFLATLDMRLAALPADTTMQAATEQVNLEPILVEVLLLARELVAERNAQVLGRTAHHLNTLYPNRKKL